jgi:DNA-binding MarR family transcriptional regulator
LVENGYLIHQRSTHDRRSIRVRLTDKGLGLLGELRDMFDRHIADIADGPVSDEELVDASVALRHLEQFWTKLLAFGTRMPAKIKAA